MRIRIYSVTGMLLSLNLSGCGTHHILQQHGNACSNTKEIKNVEVLAPDENGKLVPGKADIPAGAVIVIPPKDVSLQK